MLEENNDLIRNGWNGFQCIKERANGCETCIYTCALSSELAVNGKFLGGYKRCGNSRANDSWLTRDYSSGPVKREFRKTWFFQS